MARRSLETGPNRDRLYAAGNEASRKFEPILAKVKKSRLSLIDSC